MDGETVRGGSSRENKFIYLDLCKIYEHQKKEKNTTTKKSKCFLKTNIYNSSDNYTIIWK